ncbi:uncharacterized protein LOC128546611 [Mercenaria mercenaria]|uniref:uncharacterized protein LOC128546611 n=1 Tax=Mercenaria mercenaria TaxID=6596 RepID=UPI00234EEA73|nr:uncharacterized protein LOC128546611 [Mercenaria mercenaria]
MYVAPTIVLVGVSMSSFFFGDQLSSRIAVVTGSLTQIILQWAGVYGKLPPVSSLSLLDIWMLSNLVFVGAVLFVNAIIYHAVIKSNKAKQKKSKQDSQKKGEYEHLVRLTLICKIMVTGKPDETNESDLTAEDWKKKIKELAYPENTSDQNNPENPPDINSGGRQLTNPDGANESSLSLQVESERVHKFCRKHANAIAFICSALVYMVFLLVFIFVFWKK